MAPGDIHTIPATYGWRNEREDGATIRYYIAKTPAVADGEIIAAQEMVSHFVYDRCGSRLRRSDHRAPEQHKRAPSSTFTAK
jgi:hypothetical protein